MWYFVWVLGTGIALLLALLCAMWGEHEEAREASLQSAPDESAH